MVRIVLGIDFEDGAFIGRGRVELLERIDQHGSIAQAAKSMNMSYRRAWYLIDGFSRTFSEPIVERQHGGKGGGSAVLTPLGREIVERYRAMEILAQRSLRPHVQALRRKLAAPEARVVVQPLLEPKRKAPARKAT